MSVTLLSLYTPNFQIDRALSKARIQKPFSKFRLMFVTFTFAIALVGFLDRTMSSSLRARFEPPTNGAPDNREDAVSQWVNA